ncbi:MAG: hypothetical protein ACJ72R_09870, partial [Nitrososphaeraceae archaeon]
IILLSTLRLILSPNGLPLPSSEHYFMIIIVLVCPSGRHAMQTLSSEITARQGFSVLYYYT